MSLGITVGLCPDRSLSFSFQLSLTVFYIFPILNADSCLFSPFLHCYHFYCSIISLIFTKIYLQTFLFSSPSNIFTMEIITVDSNGKKLLLKSALSQNVCTYKEMLYQTALIPGCPHHTIPYYSYPVAISCKCGKCNTDYSDCVHEKVRTNYCTKPQKLCNM
uniref:Thyrotropin subunit beta n=2 Tax=Phasianidae TaxID=9005 RepID=G1N2F1_MELGA